MTKPTTPDHRPAFIREGLVCPHCKAFNGKSRCGCAAAREERGETRPPVADLDSIELFF